MGKLRAGYGSFVSLLTRAFQDTGLLGMRLIVAKVFLESGMTKWNGFFDFNEEKYDLFLYEFFCPDPPREGALQLCDPETLDYADGSSVVPLVENMALFAGIAEIVFPALLILGLFTRIGAAGLIGMTLFIQLLVFPSMDHWINPASWWFVVLLGVLAVGPGRLSVDALLGLDGRPQLQR